MTLNLVEAEAFIDGLWIQGDKVFAGTINQAGALEIQATAVAGQSTLARIIRMVESAQAAKAPIQRTVDTVSAVFVPAVLVVATVTL